MPAIVKLSGQIRAPVRRGPPETRDAHPRWVNAGPASQTVCQH